MEKLRNDLGPNDGAARSERSGKHHEARDKHAKKEQTRINVKGPARGVLLEPSIFVCLSHCVTVGWLVLL